MSQYLLHPDAPRTVAFEHGISNTLRDDFPDFVAMLDPQTPGFMLSQNMMTASGNRILTAGRIHFSTDDPSRFLLLGYQITDDSVRAPTSIPSSQIAGGFMVLLIVCLFVYVVLKRTFAPLEQLTAAAAEIAAGRRSVQLPQGGRGEIDALAKTLADMLREISQREMQIIRINEKLEVQVIERTQELSRANSRLLV